MEKTDGGIPTSIIYSYNGLLHIIQDANISRSSYRRLRISSSFLLNRPSGW